MNRGYEPRDSDRSGLGLTALVVDDDEGTRLLLRSVVEQLGYHAIDAADGKEALVAFVKNAPQLIIMDVLMPCMDGFQCCQAIREEPNGSDVPVVLVTGVDDNPSIERAYQVGATDFVRKPINWIILRHRIAFITRANTAFQDLKRSEARLVQAQRLAKLAAWEWHLHRREFEVSPELADLLSLRLRQARLCEDEFWSSVPEAMRERLAPTLIEALRDQRGFSVDFRLIRDRRERIIHAEGEFVSFAGGVPQVMHCIMQDVTEQYRAQEEIFRLSHYDWLTGLPNQSLFTEQLRAALLRGKRHGTDIGIIYLGLGRIRAVREAMGPAFADRVVREAALVIQDSLNSMKLGDSARLEIARYGAIEFTIFVDQLECPDPAGSALPFIAQRLLDDLSEPLKVDQQTVPVACSIGIVCAKGGQGEAETLLKYAHVAMNAARAKGERAYEFHSTEIQRQVMERFSLESALMAAVRQNALSVHFQPQIDIASGTIRGFEALARWQHADLGMIPPDRFIPIAEESGLILELGEQILVKALTEAKSWPTSEDCPILLSVNVSARQLWSRQFVQLVQRALESSGVTPTSLVLELTESVLIKNLESTLRILHSLKDLGVRLSLDDFGTGFSSMSYFRDLPMDELKIDRSFVKALEPGSRELAIVRSVISLGHNLDLNIVAEGVETEYQLKALARQGCDSAQGYLISQPMPAEAVGPYVREFEDNAGSSLFG